MSTNILFIFTLAQILALILGQFEGYHYLVQLAVFNASPPAMVFGFLDGNWSIIKDRWYFPFVLLFHIVKYIALLFSQTHKDKPSLHYTAIGMELLYIFICGAYLL